MSHNDSADAIFIGCWWNISLPWLSPVKNNPTVAARATRHPKMVAGRYMVWASLSAFSLCERTIRHAHTAAMNVPPVNNEPVTACETAPWAVLLVNSAMMLVSSARLVTGL